jgi:PGF-CTERM protein
MSDVETGDYTLRVEDDETSATTQISVVEEVSEDTETPTPEPDTETPTPEPDTETTTTTTPGFGAVVAVLALLGAALLALRRD